MPSRWRSNLSEIARCWKQFRGNIVDASSEFRVFRLFAMNSFQRGIVLRQWSGGDGYYSTASLIIHPKHRKASIESEAGITSRYQPPSLDYLVKTTKYSRREVQTMYRAFKQSCPSGTVSLTKFQQIYSHFFPSGDVTEYAGHVFRTVDSDSDGVINFEEFIQTMSVISRGSIEEKVNWIFSLYDTENRGYITCAQFYDIAQSVHRIMSAHDFYDSPELRTLAIKQFRKYDYRNKGRLSRNEFVNLLVQDSTFSWSITLFDTKL